ncbi:hypothetical protein ES703_50258 [subsurface metagenome]
MSAKERADNFERTYPQYSPLVVHNDRLYGFWLIGRWYATNRQFYGPYPPSYLNRVRALFPDCERILHLCSGSLQDVRLNEVTYDIKPDFSPNICDDIRNLLNHFQSDEFDLILADPPYEVKDFEKYSCKPFNKGKVVKECSIIVKPGGFLVWLDTMLPVFSKRDWELYGIIGLVQSTNHRTRAISIFQKEIRYCRIPCVKHYTQKEAR